MKSTSVKLHDLREKAMTFLERNEYLSPDNELQTFTEAIEELLLYQIELEVQNSELEDAYLALERSRQRYENLYQKAPTAYLTVDSRSNILEVNELAITLLDIDRQNLVGKKFLSIVTEDSKMGLFSQLEKAFSSMEEQTCEVVVRVDFLDKRYLQLQLRCYFDEKYDDTVCFVTAIDISKQKERQDYLARKARRNAEAHKQSKKLLDTVFVALEDKIIVWNSEQKLVMSNCKSNSIGEASIEDTYKAFVFEQLMPGFFQSPMPVKEPVIYEFHNTKSARYEEIQLIPVWDDEGALDLLMVHVHDVTLHKRQKQELEQHREHLELLIEQRTVALRENRDFLDAIIENLPIGLQVYDAEGYSLRMNLAEAKMMGFTNTTIGIGEFNILTDPFTESNGLLSVYQDAYKGKPTIEKEFKIRMGHEEDLWTKQKRVQHLNLTVFPIYDESKAIVAVVSLVKDITERKNTEMKLQAREKRFRRITENAFDLIAELDTEWRYLYVNKRFTEVLDYNSRELIACKFGALLHPEEKAAQQQNFDRLLEYGGTKRFKFRFRHKSGHYLWFEGGIAVCKDASGQVHILVSSRDITEQHNTEQQIRKQYYNIQDANKELRSATEELQAIVETLDDTNRQLVASRQTLKTVLDNIPALVYVTNTEDDILYVNRYTQSIFGDVVGEKCWQSLQVKQKGICSFCGRKHGSSKKINSQVVYWEHLNTKTRRWYYCSDTLINWIDGGLAHMQIATDISKQKDAELQLLRAYEKGKELKELKSGFVSMTSHQFRTPLTTIQSSIELLELHAQKTNNNYKVQFEKHSKKIYQEIDRLQDLMDDILMLGRIESGRFPFEPAFVDVVNFCEQVISQQHFSFQGMRRVQFSVKGKPTELNMDTKLMTHVISNLLSNAFKYSETEPLLLLEFEREKLKITIRDDGIGIPEEDKKHLFQGFFRAQNARKVKGTGLGLLIAKQFVDLHGGHISFESHLGQGTAFFIILPYCYEFL